MLTVLLTTARAIMQLLKTQARAVAVSSSRSKRFLQSDGRCTHSQAASLKN